MNPKISIILPVYNAEKYLASTLESVLSGSFADFEIIAVNDGSTDGSLALLNTYAERDGRIRVIDKPNTGVSDTRNVAIKAAKGEYLAFLDSDDIYAPEYLERMYLAAAKSGADVAVCDYVTFGGEAPCFETEGASVPTDVTVRELLDAGLMTSMCVKLTKRSIITENKIAFDTELAFGEDLFFSWKVCLASKNTLKLPEKLYGYRMNAQGATSRYHDRLYEKYKSAFEDLKAYARERGADEDTVRDIDIYFVKRLPTLSFMCARAKGSFFKKLSNIKNILADAVIRDITENHLDELLVGESRGGVSLYRAAARQNAMKVYLYGAKLELRLKLARLKRRVGGKK